MFLQSKLGVWSSQCSRKHGTSYSSKVRDQWGPGEHAGHWRQDKHHQLDQVHWLWQGPVELQNCCPVLLWAVHYCRLAINSIFIEGIDDKLPKVKCTSCIQVDGLESVLTEWRTVSGRVRATSSWELALHWNCVSATMHVFQNQWSSCSNLWLTEVFLNWGWGLGGGG